MIRALALFLGLIFIAACTPKNLDQPPAALGNFKLGHNIVVASKMQKGPVSRAATEDEWTNALKSAVDRRFGRYSGESTYHFGVSVEGYMLAPPGLPLVYTPKSALILNVTVWDDKAGKKLNSKPHQITVLEDTNQDSILIGSGWGRTKEEQIEGLSYNAIFAIEDWLLEQKEQLGWFTGGPIREAPPPEPAVNDGV